VTVLNAVKSVPEVCSIFCATANPTKVVVTESSLGKEHGRAILGVVDGFSPKGVETKEEASERHSFLRKIGYKR
jgi:adenosine/AMP kinase